MSYWNFTAKFLYAFLMSLGWIVTIIPPILLYGLCSIVSKHLHIDLSYAILICFGTLQFFIFIGTLKSEYEDQKERDAAELTKAKSLFEKEMKYKRSCFEREKKQFAEKVKTEEQQIANLKNTVMDLLMSKSPFKKCATMATDVELHVYNDTISYLRNKRRPGLSSAECVKQMKQQSKEILLKSKEIEYKYDYILNVFPEIAEYVENDEELISIGERLSYSDLKEERDTRKDYLTKEEYARLSDDEKSQLALDRYIASRNKSRWEIGRDYEMSCAMQLQQQGFYVDLHGIKYRTEDLGRDIIARRNIGGLCGKEIWIVQCKNWSKERIIHENVIMQLFGTATEFSISLGENHKHSIVPVLMIPPYSVLSELANKFAQKLKVKVQIMDNKDFPRIKCNINHGLKIYHLPFDQLYDRTEIRLRGECYAWNVKEAVSKGFRRANRHIFDKDR